MIQAARHVFWMLCITMMLALGCSKKNATLPANLEAVPENVTAIINVDARALLNFFRDDVLPMIPTDLKKNMPPWDEVTQKAKELAGIDFDKLGNTLVVLRISKEEPLVAVIGPGIDLSILKGEKSKDHQGVPIYRFKDAYYAGLEAGQTLFSVDESFLIEVLDAKAGRVKRFMDSPRASEIGDLLSRQGEFNHIRAVLVQADPSLFPFPPTLGVVKALGLYLHLKQGLTIAVLSDEAGAERFKTTIESGAAMAKAQLSTMDIQKIPNLPQGLDPKMFSSLANMLGQIKVQKDGTMVSATLLGDVGTFFLGMGAAVAIPAFLSYIRQSKTSEVNVLLDVCHRGVVDYYEKERILPNGSMVSGQLPPAMTEPVCPNGGTIQTLSDNSDLIDYAKAGKNGEIMKQFYWEIRDPVYGCYQYTVENQPSVQKEPDAKAVKGKKAKGKKAKEPAKAIELRDGPAFTCHAWTDIDGNGKQAHWMKTVDFVVATKSFKARAVWHDPKSDEW